MLILKENPPNIVEIQNMFTFDSRSTVFCWDSIIYNPGGVDIPDDVIVHEQVHSKQQKGDPKGWWDKYLSDVDFRITQEVEAYGKQYQFICGKIKDRNKQAKLLSQIASLLSGKMYGKVINYSEAIKRIKYYDESHGY